MPSKKAIKRRIISVKATKQIMKAMDMVAASKLQRVKQRLVAARPLFKEANRIADTLKSNEHLQENAFVKPREVKNTAYVVITSNRGLCGSYNANISNKALAHMNDKNENIIAVGLKGRDYFKRREKNIVHVCAEATETLFFSDAENIAETVMDLYASGKADEVYVAYTRFENAMTYTPSVTKILPIGDGSPPVIRADAMKYEPDAETFLKHAIPEYLNAFIFGAMLEANSSEQASRMLSMSAATKNATEIIDDLTLLFNRKRQADITQEIIEIVGGASVV
ncbi:MAG: ATP synthase F1 subunit gamma [Defluviitaleaceae bacterium]|nr:ATP synthase F1 subunit gamma [Defluviitaleaceae bacterium]